MNIDLFDCNAMIGRRILRNEKEFKTANDLIKEMDYLGISQALVYHSLAKEYSPSIGNKHLLEELVFSDRLHPCWVIMPHHTGEMEKPESLISSMIEQSVRAVRMFPAPPIPPAEFSLQLHRYALIGSVCGELFTALENHQIPLFLEIQTFSAFPLVSWQEIEWILRNFKSLILVIGGLRQRDNRTLYALLERFQNLYLDISIYAAHRGIEDIVKQFGASRMLFGTGLPVFSGSGSIIQLIYSEIEDTDMQMIAGSNLVRLLGGGENGN
jgi:hypothetical protein